MRHIESIEALAERLIEGVFARFFRRPEAPAGTSAETQQIRRVSPPASARQWSLVTDGQRFELGEPVVHVGRALDNDIVLTGPTVSRYHAQLRWREGRYSVQDVGSRHGVRVNQVLVSEQALAAGDLIQLGETELSVEVRQ